MSQSRIESRPPAGLYYLSNVIPPQLVSEFFAWFRSESVQKSLFHVITDNNPEPLKTRKVLHFGYTYDYLHGKVAGVTHPMPSVIEKLRDLIFDVTDVVPSDYHFNQSVLNHYLPGQEIPPHKDHSSFGEYIASFTIGSEGIVGFHHHDHPHYEFRAEHGSLFIMSGPSRHEFLHSAKNDEPIYPHSSLEARTRISITFRNFQEKAHS